MSGTSEPPPPVEVTLDEFLCFPLHAATRAITRVYAVLLEPFGLTYPQYLVVVALDEADSPQSVGALGARLRLDSGTLTPLLKRLEQRGLVTRGRDPEDERRVLVALDGDGCDLARRLAGVPARAGAATGLDWDQVTRLRGDLAALIEHLDAWEDAAGLSPDGPAS